MAIKLTDENFEKEVNATDKLVVVDFFATWCEPCQVLGPIIEKAVKGFEDEVVLMKVNVDQAPVASQKFNVDRIPNVVCLKNGKQMGGFTGLIPESAIKEWLTKMIKENNTPQLASEPENKQEIIEKLKKEYAEYARANGFKLNPDNKTVERIINGLLMNKEKYGEMYCPCRRITGDKTEDAKKICACFWHKDEIKKDGHCFCNLYVKE